MTQTIFIELTLLLAVTIFISGIMRVFKQPLIIGYIISGILVGPFFLNLLSSRDAISTFAQIGVVLLLFFVGLNLNPKVIRETGKISFITGVGQVVFTSVIGFFICRFLGFGVVPSIYIAVALTFSSTIIIMKLLSDRRDLDSLYGRIAIGFLIVQDLIAIFVLMAISSIPLQLDMVKLLTDSLVKGVGIIFLLFLVSNYLFPRIISSMARSEEFLLLFVIAWCFTVASALHALNFSFEAGALLAGISLSLSPHHFEISSRIKPIRDFFLVLFFLVLGSQMQLSGLSSQIPTAIILSLFILVGNPLIVMVLMGMMGYSKRNGFMAGLTVAQISEFSLILIILGVQVGHLTPQILSLVTLVAGSTYMIIYADRLYAVLARYLGVFERRGPKADEKKPETRAAYEIILFGCGRTGSDILASLIKLKKKFLVIDYNPELINRLIKEGYNGRYGDAGDIELLNDLDLSAVKMLISTIPQEETNSLLLSKIRQVNPECIVIVVSHHIEEALELYKAGATYVILPHLLSGHHTATMIERNQMDIAEFIKEKSRHIESLKIRREGEYPQSLSPETT